MGGEKRYSVRSSTSFVRDDLVRKPDWFKIKIPSGEKHNEVDRLMQENRLHSICQEGLCPNRHECWNAKTASFMILGDICTRSCKYCNVKSGRPTELDWDEPRRLAQAIEKLQLKYVVITSVTRDDLQDGGAAIFADCVVRLKKLRVRVELLVPDFRWNEEALQCVLASKPEVVGHNIETVPSFYEKIRPSGNYQKALELLEKISHAQDVVSKTAFMLGVGENWDDIEELLQDLRKAKVARLSVGQYLRPSKEHWPVDRYYHPDEYLRITKRAYELGFEYVQAGPLVRSSYHAEQAENTQVY